MSIAAKFAAQLRERLTAQKVSEVADILAIAERFGYLDGISSAHTFDLIEGAGGVGFLLCGHGLTIAQNTYAPGGPSPEESECVPLILGAVRFVFINLNRRDHVAWLLAVAERQQAEYERPATRIGI